MPPSNISKSSLQYLTSRVLEYKTQGIIIAFLGVFVSLTHVITLSFMKLLMDILFSDAEKTVKGMSWIPVSIKEGFTNWLEVHLFHNINSGLRLVAVTFIIFALLNTILNVFHKILSQRLSENFKIKLFKELYSHLMFFSISDIYKRRQGDIVSRFTTDIRTMQEAVQEVFQILIKEPFTVFFALMACFLFNWKLTLFALTIFPIVGLIIAILSKRLRKLSVNESETMGELLHQVSESISGIHIIKIFQSEKFLLQTLYKRSQTYLKTIFKIIKIQALTSPIIEFLGQLSFILVIIALAPSVQREEISVGDLTTIIVLLGHIYKPVKSSSNALQKISRCLGATDRFMELRNTSIEPQGGNASFPKTFNSIEFKNLDFSYDNEKYILRQFNAKILKGQTVAIVGPTGAGKTTLIQLIPKFFEIPEDSIFLNQLPFEKYSTNSLRDHIALVSQNVFLFNDTVLNNIALGLDVSENDVIKAAKAAHADDFIRQLPEGYQTIVGDRGIRLSGGQCQRISIARAFLKNPPILLLDEATSALDSETERYVQQSIEQLAKGRTTIIIAHRLSTIQHADNILYLEKGSLIESGTHQDLLAKNGSYANLYNKYINHEPA